MTRYLFITIVLLTVALVAGCQSAVVPAPINATYDWAGPPVLGEPANFEDTCLLPIKISYAFSGDLEGVATFQAQVLHDGLCGPDTKYCDYNEKWVADGVYEGEVKDRAGTFDFFLVVMVNECHFDAQMVIEPDTGTGDLAGINGIITFDEEPDDEAPWPVIGYIYYAPVTPVAEAATGAVPGEDVQYISYAAMADDLTEPVQFALTTLTGEEMAKYESYALLAGEVAMIAQAFEHTNVRALTVEEMAKYESYAPMAETDELYVQQPR